MGFLIYLVGICDNLATAFSFIVIFSVIWASFLFAMAFESNGYEIIEVCLKCGAERKIEFNSIEAGEKYFASHGDDILTKYKYTGKYL